MKHILLLALFITAMVGADPAVEINKKYIGGIYTFSGTVETKNGPIISTSRFTGKTTAETFECEWVDELGQKGLVKINPKGGSVTMPGIGEQKYADPMIAIASATGVSDGSVLLMYGLWKGQKDKVFPSANLVVSKTKEGFLVSGDAEVAGGKLLVSTTKDNFITSVKTLSDPSKIKLPELSDQEIKETLKALNKPETPEEIEAMRNMMKFASGAAAASKDEIITTTTIAVNWPK